MFKKNYFLIIFVVFLIPNISKAQTNIINFNNDSVLQLYGVILSADSLKGVSFCTIIVENKGRGTISNKDGVFSIAVFKGDNIIFTSIGYKLKKITIPKNLKGNDYNIIQLMINDTTYLAATILRPRPTREQFERDFVNNNVKDDLYETARKNIIRDKNNRFLFNYLPKDGGEAYNITTRETAAKFYSLGQLPPNNLFNPFAWADFIQAWKRGDFKKN